MDHAPDGPYVTAAAIAALYHVPTGTIHRWAHEDRWRRRHKRPKAYHLGDAETSYLRRRALTPRGTPPSQGLRHLRTALTTCEAS